MRVVVIGAGIGGLSAAAHLVGAGHDVTVVEREARAGGRAGLVREHGFVLDTGPTVLTMPHLVEATFAAAGRDMSQYLTIEPVDPMYRAVFADGSELRVRAGRDAMREEIRRFANAREAGAFGEFCDWVTELYQLEMPTFIDTNYDSVIDVLRPWRRLLDLIRLGGFGRLDEKVATFFDDERLQRLFGFPSLFAGLVPHDALALFAVMSYADTIGGVFTAPGGIHTVPEALAAALADVGVDVRYDTPVTRILRGGEGRVSGVELGDSVRVRADAVVCNVDLPVAYRTLLGGVDAPRVARRGRYSPSCLLWVAGVRGRPPEGAARHNIHFGRDSDEASRALVRRGRRSADPSTLVTLPALGDESLVPSGCTAIHARELVPNLDGKIDWAGDGDRIADELRRRVGALGYPFDDVVVERTVDPLDWEAMGLERGTPFALAHTVRQSGPFRPGNVDRRVPGLVFTGASTVPGVGVPTVLLSGKLAAERVERFARETSILRW